MTSETLTAKKYLCKDNRTGIFVQVNINYIPFPIYEVCEYAKLPGITFIGYIMDDDSILFF